MDEYILKYNKSAINWEESLPLGNGRLGACVFGRVDNEIIRINEKTLWEGYEHDWSNPETKLHLKEIQRLFLAKKYVEAAELTTKYYKCLGDGEGEKYDGQPYGTFRNVGDIVLVDKSVNRLIERRLNILSGVAETDTESYIATHYISLAGNVGVTEIKAKGKGVSLDIRFDKEGGGRNNDTTATGIRVNEFNGFEVTKDVNKPYEGVTVLDDALTYSHRFLGDGALEYAFMLKIVTDGKLTSLADGLNVTNAEKIKLIYTAHTEFDTENIFEANEKAIADALKNDRLFDESKEKLASLMTRSTLSLESDESLKAMYTDERLKRIKNGGEDV